ncbi:plasmid pRiA4b ORF-3 family protein [Dactylosporangium sp. AC04546]|uniref:plasmid pRiA4b ORF-3 family protein n=1 Tax=Dactylosporangium sp. AC04546 TaxID=2862460 RepID=UPI001EDEEF7F|nr:plasmid pRiA4b ORF-3 family protein [Dactylosporangium sp. AC04546]WVK85466.1 plasmid pRiA4b ORF-3 family protein [Dactylosporangium sp. AC04546]
MARSIYQLRIALDGVTPPVWRRVLVPGAFTLDRVHRVVQFAMGWGDRHLHVFDVEGVQYGVPDPDGLLDVRDELDVRLDAAAQKGSRLRYTYDFGDWWEHDLVVEDVMPADLDIRYPVCVGGEQACPPDDVGGPEGYRDFLRACADPTHPEHAAMREWLPGDFDPTAFDAARATALLRRMT